MVLCLMTDPFDAYHEERMKDPAFANMYREYQAAKTKAPLRAKFGRGGRRQRKQRRAK